MALDPLECRRHLFGVRAAVLPDLVGAGASLLDVVPQHHHGREQGEQCDLEPPGHHHEQQPDARAGSASRRAGSAAAAGAGARVGTATDSSGSRSTARGGRLTATRPVSSPRPSLGPAAEQCPWSAAGPQSDDEAEPLAAQQADVDEPGSAVEPATADQGPGLHGSRGVGEAEVSAEDVQRVAGAGVAGSREHHGARLGVDAGRPRARRGSAAHGAPPQSSRRVHDPPERMHIRRTACRLLHDPPRAVASW